MKTTLQVALSAGVVVLAFSGCCLAVNVALLGEVIAWPSAIGPARVVELGPTPPEDGIRFANSPAVTYGSLQLGNGSDTTIALAFEGGMSPKLWVDQDNDEDLLDDTDPEWDKSSSDNAFTWVRSVTVSYSDSADLDYTGEYIVSISAYRDPGGCWDLIYSSFCLRKGLLWTEDGTVAVWLGDMDTDGLYDDLAELTVIVDADGDSVPSIDYSIPEIFHLGYPYGVGRIQVLGSTYDIQSVTYAGKRMLVSRAQLQEPPLLPLFVGGASPEFSTVALDGTHISTASLLGNAAILVFTPIFGDSDCASCAAASNGTARACDLARMLLDEAIPVIAVSTAMEAPPLQVLDCEGVSIPIIWDEEILRLFRPRIDWLVVIGSDGTILGKDSARPAYDSIGNITGVATRPLSVAYIHALVFGGE